MSKVYLRNIYEFKNTVMIYKGKEDGIVEGMAVISDMGLIGVVDNTLASSSEVRLITNKSSNISVKVGDNYGILKMADGVLVVSNLQTYDVINIGDKVYCYYVDTGFLWRKKEAVITDISSMYIFTDEKELIYTENQKKY